MVGVPTVVYYVAAERVDITVAIAAAAAARLRCTADTTATSFLCPVTI
jgi:hypothetical protein